MKKQLSMILAASALLFSVTSCNKEIEPVAPTGEGSINIALDFEKPSQTAPETKAATSTAKPTTSWSKNINDLTLVLTESTSGKVKVLRDMVKPGTETDYAAAFTGVPTGSYKVYVLANIKATGNPHVTGVTAKAQPLKVGDNIDTKLYELLAMTPAVAGYDAYNEPAEVFIAKSANAVVITDGDTNKDLENNPLQLTRAVSLLRIRLNKTSEYAAQADFNAGRGIHFRRMSNKLSYVTGLGSAINGANPSGLFSNKQFKSVNPTGGYLPLDMGLGADFSQWNDYVIIPGGGTTTGSGFNLVLTAKVPAGYVDAGGVTAPAAGAVVFWQAAITSKIAANEILELNVSFTSPGKIIDPSEPIPPIQTYGTMNVKVKLSQWGAIKSQELPM